MLIVHVCVAPRSSQRLVLQGFGFGVYGLAFGVWGLGLGGGIQG
jgi:hypothetical protein